MKLRIVLVVITGCLVSMFNACGPAGDSGGSSDGGSNGVASANNIAAFKPYYDWSRGAGRCVSCHSSQSAQKQAPLFADADVNVAYSDAKKKLVLTAPETSSLIEHAGSGHCGSICAAANVATVTPLVTAWAQAELASSTDNTGAATIKYTTASVSLPSTIPVLASNAQPAVVRFELSQMSPTHPALTNAVLEVEVQRTSDSTPTTYRFNRVKIAGNTAAVSVKGIHVYLKAPGASGVGAEDPNQGMGWVSVQATAPTFARPATLPATPLGATPVTSTAINSAKRAGTGQVDVITIGIENLQ